MPKQTPLTRFKPFQGCTYITPPVQGMEKEMTTKTGTLEIDPDQIKIVNWRVGDILEDVRHGSPTKGYQFAITDYVEGVVRLNQLSDEEYVVASEITSRIYK